MRICWATRGALSDAHECVTSAPSREAALGRWQVPGGSRSSTTKDGDERRRRGGGSSSSARSPGDRAGHDPGLGGGGAAPTVRVLLRLRDEGVAAAGGLSHREVPGGGAGGGGEGRTCRVVSPLCQAASRREFTPRMASGLPGAGDGELLWFLPSSGVNHP